MVATGDRTLVAGMRTPRRRRHVAGIEEV